MSNANDIDELSHFYGGEGFTKYLLGYITEGAKTSAELFNSFWFLDLCFSYQSDPKFNVESFQGWKLTRVKDCEFCATCDDGNGNILGTQEIEYSDFPHDEFTLWLCDGVLMLPSEY